MRRPIVAGNWKCHLTVPEATELVQQLVSGCDTDAVDVVVCPAFTALAPVGVLLEGSVLQLGAQDVFWEAQGAFTGEVSPAMLRDVGCRYVIVGHSERRRVFGESDETVRRKLRAVFAHNLKPILCIGETLEEREAGRTAAVLERQLEGALEGADPAECERLVVAYEPVWAIGTGRHAAPEQAQEAHQTIRRWLAGRLGERTAKSVRIQYGGSVTAVNAGALLGQPDVDGALVGGASLKAGSFGTIVKAAHETQAVNR
ncbi:MAG TPA: triose-phosphate isomerase [bacterium]